MEQTTDEIDGAYGVDRETTPAYSVLRKGRRASDVEKEILDLPVLSGDALPVKSSTFGSRRDFLRMRAERYLSELKYLNKEMIIGSNCEVNVAPKDLVTQTNIRHVQSDPAIGMRSESSADDWPDGSRARSARDQQNYMKGKLCMVSAVRHVKCLEERKPKSIVQLRRKPMTTAEEKGLRGNVEELRDEGAACEDGLACLRNCRYLRCASEDTKLSMTDIFN